MGYAGGTQGTEPRQKGGGQDGSGGGFGGGDKKTPQGFIAPLGSVFSLMVAMSTGWS